MEEIGEYVPIVWRGRRAEAFVPSLLADRGLTLAAQTVVATARAQAAVERGAASMPDDHVALARLLMRAEGIASSFIEGLSAPVADVVVAENMAGGTRSVAGWVAANLDASSEAIASAHDGPLDVDHLLRWHSLLMAGSPTPERHVGRLRIEQGWIGGTSPFDAHLVTPPPDLVPTLVDDLVAFVNRSDVDPVLKAAVAHAQFELIHPFADGNGRIGRILVSWVLVRDLALVTAPPVSTHLSADVGGYASGLVLYRLGDLDRWVQWFASAVSGAGRAQEDLVASVAELTRRWRDRLGSSTGRPIRLRSDAAAWRVLALVPSMLAMTAPDVAHVLQIPPKSAAAALQELAAAGILAEHGTISPAGHGRPRRLYVCPELLGLTGSSPTRR